MEERIPPVAPVRDPAVHVRDFRASDEEPARRLVLAGLGERFGFVDATLNPDLQTIAAHYPERGHVFLVAERAGRLVGTSGLVFEAPGRARIVRVAVDRRERRRGIARVLLDEVRRRALARGVRELRVATQPEWTDAVELYRSEGFVPYDRDPIDVHFRCGIAPRAGRGHAG